MTYRTKTYIAGDWTGDQDLIAKLYEWNDNDDLMLHFVDAHDLTQSSDSSLNCSIKDNLSIRMDASKTFVLIVGDKTKTLKAGSCSCCRHYSYSSGCDKGWSTSKRSFIEYECDKAVRDGLKIVVIYNSAYVIKSRCPDVVANKGSHIAGYSWVNGFKRWNYTAIKNAIMD